MMRTGIRGTKCWLFVWALSLALVSSEAQEANQMRASGVVIFLRNAAYSDKMAEAFEYVSYISHPTLKRFLTPRGKSIEILAMSPSHIVSFDLSKRENIMKGQLAIEYRGREVQLKMLGERFPKARNLLQEERVLLDEIATNLEGGNYWFEGRWQPKEEVEGVLAKREKERLDKIASDKQMAMDAAQAKERAAKLREFRMEVSLAEKRLGNLAEEARVFHLQLDELEAELLRGEREKERHLRTFVAVLEKLLLQ